MDNSPILGKNNYCPICKHVRCVCEIQPLTKDQPLNLSNRFCFRAWIEIQKYMAIQGTPDLETLQSFMFHYGDAKHLMQYTGLDDCNSVKIFEGDIVKFTRTTGNWIGKYITDVCEIIFDNECSRFALKYNSNIQKLRKHFGYKYEVIGNIFQTPELLNTIK